MCLKVLLRLQGTWFSQADATTVPLLHPALHLPWLVCSSASAGKQHSNKLCGDTADEHLELPESMHAAAEPCASDSTAAAMLHALGLACIRSDTACSCDLSPCSLVTACLLRINDLAMTFTASCEQQKQQTHQVSISSDCATADAEVPQPLRQCMATYTHHLPLFGHLLDLCYSLLFLVLQAYAFSVQFANGFVQHALVLPQHLCGSLFLSKQPLHVSSVAVAAAAGAELLLLFLVGEQKVSVAMPLWS